MTTSITNFRFIIINKRHDNNFYSKLLNTNSRSLQIQIQNPADLHISENKFLLRWRFGPRLDSKLVEVIMCQLCSSNNSPCIAGISLKTGAKLMALILIVIQKKWVKNFDIISQLYFIFDPDERFLWPGAPSWDDLERLGQGVGPVYKPRWWRQW